MSRVALLAGLLIWLAAAPASAELTIDAPPSLRATADRIRAIDLDALDQALRRAGLERPDGVRITLLPEDDARVRAVPGWIVGFALGDSDIVIFPGRVLAYPYDSLESVVRHEVTHLALNAAARGEALPRWFHEGVATSVDAGWGISAQVRLAAALVRDGRTARLDRLFAIETESAMQQAYLLSAVLVSDLRRRHGDDVPGAIVRRMAAGAPFGEAFAAETGETPDAAAATAWAAYRRWTAWIPAMTGASAAWAFILVLAFVAYAVQIRKRWRRRHQWDDEDSESAL